MAMFYLVSAFACPCVRKFKGARLESVPVELACLFENVAGPQGRTGRARECVCVFVCGSEVAKEK